MTRWPMQTKADTLQSTAEAAVPWHARLDTDALSALGSSLEGLSQQAAVERLAADGPNTIERRRAAGPWRLLLSQINNPLIWVLLGSGGLAMAFGKLTDGAVVLGVVVLNSIIGFVQEYRAGRAIEALAEMVPVKAVVLREGEQRTLPAAQLVAGDVVLLAAGDRVPADGRLLAARQLRIEEAALTGESMSATKQLKPVEVAAGIGDRPNMVFGGTLVTHGTGTAVLVATGARTELGRISGMLKEVTKLKTRMSCALAAIAKVLTIAILGVAALLFGVGLLRGYALGDAALAAIALAVGAIPEGLPAIVTIALAVGVRRMAARNAIVRKLPAVETLGSTTVICTDKTGTLTRNEMTVQALWSASGRYSVTGVGYEPTGQLERDGTETPVAPADVIDLVESAALCGDATLRRSDKRWQVSGDPTEGALVVVAEKLGIDVQARRDEAHRIDVVPFDAVQQFMATLHVEGDHSRVLLKGSPEAVMQRSVLPDGCQRSDALAEVERLAGQGMRVLAVAAKEAGSGQKTLTEDDVTDGFAMLGLVAMIDPPRPEAITALATCHRAGIAVKMITGDHRATAAAIGKQLGMEAPGEARTGAELGAMSPEQLAEAADQSAVFARVAPEHKLALVTALQARGEVVAMTGDGVNDAPAIKQANIGVAMGITGTAAAREAADMVLADDNFATIAAAVEEGRRVYDNLIKSLVFVLPTNIGLALILMISVLFLPVQEIAGGVLPAHPLQPTQLLWINLIAAVALALPLAFEASERDVMSRPPRSPDQSVLSPFVLQRTAVIAVLMTAGAVGVFFWSYGNGSPTLGHELALARAQTMVVGTVVAFQIFYLFNCRSLRGSILEVGLLSNPALFVGIGVVMFLQVGFMFAPPLQRLFGSTALSPGEIAMTIGAGACVLPGVFVEKRIRRALARRAARNPDD